MCAICSGKPAVRATNTPNSGWRRDGEPVVRWSLHLSMLWGSYSHALPRSWHRPPAITSSRSTLEVAHLVFEPLGYGHADPGYSIEMGRLTASRQLRPSRTAGARHVVDPVEAARRERHRPGVVDELAQLRVPDRLRVREVFDDAQPLGPVDSEFHIPSSRVDYWLNRAGWHNGNNSSSPSCSYTIPRTLRRLRRTASGTSAWGIYRAGLVLMRSCHHTHVETRLQRRWFVRTRVRSPMSRLYGHTSMSFLSGAKNLGWGQPTE